MCCEPISLLHSSHISSCEQKLCEPISLLHSYRVSSCEQKLCEPISLLHSSRASSCEQKLREPISLSLERALSSETGSQDPCSARYAVTAWQHFMLLWLQTSLCYLSHLVLIFRPGAPKTMLEEYYTHCIISTRAISTGAISINSAFSCYLQIFHSFIGYLRCFIANLLVLIFLDLFCICAI